MSDKQIFEAGDRRPSALDWHCWLVPIALLAASAHPAAAQSTVPAVTLPATQEHHAGKVVFEELVTPDLAVAKAFYAGLFGWTYQDVQGLRYPYAEAYNNGRPVAGLVEKPLPAGAHLPAAWLNFLSVSDLDHAMKIAVADGAKKLVEAHDVAGRGREAVLSDPAGAVFSLLVSSSGDSPDTLVPTGGWIWHSITAADAQAEGAFYKSVLGCDVMPYPDSAQDHFVLASDTYARASLNTLPPGHPTAHAHWLGYVRVNAVSASLAALTRLGGRVLAGPWTDRHGGMMAVVADPAGAPFGLMEWSELDSKEVGQ